jgi:hypothetical protein
MLAKNKSVKIEAILVLIGTNTLTSPTPELRIQNSATPELLQLLTPSPTTFPATTASLFRRLGRRLLEPLLFPTKADPSQE